MMKRAAIFFLILGFALPAHALKPTDPYLDNQWYLKTIHAYEAWDTAQGTDEVVVAVLDTGVDLDHPDIRENLWRNMAEVESDGLDNDGNGYVDDVHGWDFVEGDNSPTPDTGESSNQQAVVHGTAIAGVIGAVGNNGQGIAGINWHVKIMPVRILDNFGSGNSVDARHAIEYAVANGATIVNSSFVGFEYDEFLLKTVEDARKNGVLFVAAVGNDGKNGGIDLDEKPIYPACFKNDSMDLVMGVASTTPADTKSSFSNYGATCTDISAPGENIFSSVYFDPSWDGFATQEYGGGWSGTSIAAPMVAGAAALIKSAFPSLQANELRVILQLSVDALQERDTKAAGKLGPGRLNVARALQIASGFVQLVSSPSSLSSPGSLSSTSSQIIVAPESGVKPLVRIFTPQGQLVHSFLAYEETFLGGVRLALGDTDGDGAYEIVTVPGRGGSSRVRVFEQDGTLVDEFVAFDRERRTGFFVAVDDLDNDGREDIAVSEDAGGAGTVALFYSGKSDRTIFTPYGVSRVSVRVALGDPDGDGKTEIVTVPGKGVQPLGKIFSATGALEAEFMAYAPTYQEGVFVAVGDLDGNGAEEIVTGTDNGGGPHTRIFGGDGRLLGTFFAYDELFRGGVRLSVGKFSQGPASILTAAGPGGGPHVRVFNGQGKVIGGFFSDKEADRNGINVAAWTP